MAPAGVPHAILQTLNAGIVKALEEPDTKARLLRVAAEAAPSTQEAFGLFLRSEIAKWAKVVKDARIVVDG